MINKILRHNVHFVAIAFLFFGLFGFSNQSTAQTENPPTLDFEEDGAGTNWTWMTFENEDNPPLQFIDNPDESGINTSETVARFTARADGAPWAGTRGTGPTEFLFSDATPTITIMVWKSKISDVGIKLETASDWAQPEIRVANTVTNEWEEITIDFSGRENPPGGEPFNGISVFPDFGDRDEDVIVYFDNISFSGFAVVGSGPIPPSVPGGFVVANEITGEPPLDPGKVFLAAGPNDVQQPNIRYRLFYTITADAPQDPRDATEYSFGSTEGDGGANDAFGFTMSGLEPGTEYTFYLYQYNIETQMFSPSPAVGTVVSSGEATSIGNYGEQPVRYALGQNYPNPFNPSTQIQFALPESGQVNLEVFNMMGQRVATLVNGSMNAGNHTVTFDAADLASGMYMYRLQAGNTVLTKKMTLVK